MSRFVDAIKAAVEQYRTSGAYHVVNPNIAGRAYSPGIYQWDTSTILNLGQRASETVAGCMTFRAESVAEAPLRVRVDDEFDDTHELSRLFSAPNSYWSSAELIETLVYDLDSSPHGTFLLVELDRRGMPAELWHKRSDEIRIVPSTTEYIERFEERRGSAWFELDPSVTRVVWIRHVDPTDPWGSLPPLLKAQRSVRTIRATSEFLDYILQNMDAVPGFISLKGSASPESLDRAEAILREKWASRAEAGRTRILDNDASYVRTGLGLSDVNFGELDDRIETRICSAFRVPPVVAQTFGGLQMAGGLGGDKVKELKAQAYHDAVMPLAKKIASAIALALAPFYEIDIHDVAFDFSNVEALQSDVERRLKMARDATYWTIDEKREFTGKDALESGGDICLEAITGARMLAPAIAPVAAPARTDEDEQKTRERKSLKYAEWKAVDDAARAVEPEFEKAATRAFASEAKRLEREFDKHKSRKMSDDELLEIADGVFQSTNWGELMSDPILLGYEYGVNAANLSGLAFNVSDPRAVAAALRRADKITGTVTDANMQIVRDIIAKGRDEGLSMNDIADRIVMEWQGDMPAYRATRIARTESIGSANEGAFLGAGQASETLDLTYTKEWLSAGDDQVRDSHRIDGESVALDDRFSNGLMYPGDIEASDPADVVNCRCAVLYEAT